MDSKRIGGTANSIIDILMSDHKLAIELLSLYYPFSEDEIEQYWDVLEHGDAHYTVYLHDTDGIYSPRIGLCFNRNVNWSASLRSRWKCGFDDLCNGYVVGAGDPCEFDERSSRSTMIPLSVVDDLALRHACEVQRLIDFEEIEELCEPLQSESFFARVTKMHPRLDFEQFKFLYETDREVVLLNRSIWNNTIAREISKTDLPVLLRGRVFALENVQEKRNGIAEARIFPYTLAHRITKNEFLVNPQRFYELSSPELRRGLIDLLWEKTQSEVHSGAPPGFTIRDLHVRQVTVGLCRPVIIRFPEPCGATECHLALGVVGDCGTSSSGRYFTLEWSRVQSHPEIPLTVLGEWTPDDSHINYGIGPAPEEADFINVVNALLERR